MKQSYYLLFFLFIGIVGRLNSQSFLNGNFEVNSTSGCDYNLTDAQFNAKISHVHAFGKGYGQGGYLGETDFQTFNCYVNPQDGNWCIGLSSDTFLTADAISLELSSNLVIGQSYQLSFYVYGNTYSDYVLGDIKIGLSTTDSTFGTLLYSGLPDADTWKHIVFDFTASDTAKYITVTNAIGIQCWNQVDNFTFGLATDVSRIFKHDEISLFPNPFSSVLTLKTENAFRNGTITLFNALGERVQEIKNVTSQSLTINRDGLPSGLYLLQLEQDSKMSTHKIVIADK